MQMKPTKVIISPDLVMFLLPEDPWPILCPEVPGEESRLAREPCWSASLDSSSFMISHPEHHGLRSLYPLKPDTKRLSKLKFPQTRLWSRLERSYPSTLTFISVSRVCRPLHANAASMIRIQLHRERLSNDNEQSISINTQQAATQSGSAVLLFCQASLEFH